MGLPLDEALARFDAENAEDPRTERVGDKEVPKELLYAQRMTARLDAFAPEAPEHVRLAARAQHICRWRIPRSDYPDGRAGYLKWRTDLSKMHADLTGKIMQDVGYESDMIERVQTLMRKRGLKTDPDVQLLEDVICLVFLEHYFHDFAKQHDEQKLIGIIQKTWNKMTSRAHQAALALDLEPQDRSLLMKALQAEQG